MAKIYTAIPTLLGLLFFYTGVSKAIYPGEPTIAVMALGLSPKAAGVLMIFVAAIEIYLGVILLLRFDLRFALLSCTGLLLAFCAFLFYLSMIAHPPSCGCLGLTGAFSNGREGARFGIVRNCLILWLLRGAYEYYSSKPAVGPEVRRP